MRPNFHLSIVSGRTEIPPAEFEHARLTCCFRSDTNIMGVRTVAIRDKMSKSATVYLQPGEEIQAVFGAQTANQFLAAVGGIFVFLGLNRFRIFVATPQRILVLDAGKVSVTKARGVVAELPRSTRLGPGSGLWHMIPVGSEKLRVHRRFFKDIEAADAALDAASRG